MNLNKQFTHWVEQDYNATVHSVLDMKPIDRFRSRPFADSLSLSQRRYRRTVLRRNRANTSKRTTRSAFAVNATRLRSTCAGERSRCAHDRHRGGAVIVYDGDRRIGKARLLNAEANGMSSPKRFAVATCNSSRKHAILPPHERLFTHDPFLFWAQPRPVRPARH